MCRLAFLVQGFEVLSKETILDSLVGKTKYYAMTIEFQGGVVLMSP